jgi:hypothetical protein
MSIMRFVWRSKSLRADAVMPLLNPIVSRLRSALESLSAWLRKLVGTDRRTSQFARQRVCPFCGLITPRGKAYCLECGKSFKLA